MIRPTARTKCCGCYGWATRQVLDCDGGLIWLCSKCPDPQQIRERSAAVREGWDDTTFICRAKQCPRPAARDHDAVYYDQPTAVVTWGGLKME